MKCLTALLLVSLPGAALCAEPFDFTFDGARQFSELRIPVA
jgi:hypothetical protein